MADAFAGVWNLERSENFEEYMKKIGVGMITRKAASAIKPVVTITVDGDTWKFTSASKLKTQTQTWVVDGKPHEMETLDGRKVSAVFKLEDGKLIETQTPLKDGPIATTVREVKNGELHMTLIFGDVTCLRVYTKQ